MDNGKFVEPDISAMESAIKKYFKEADRQLNVPFVEGLCLAIGTDSKTFIEWTKESGERGDLARYALQYVLAKLEEAVLDEDISPVIYIFLMKQFAGYSDDVQEDKWKHVD